MNAVRYLTQFGKTVVYLYPGVGGVWMLCIAAGEIMSRGGMVLPARQTDEVVTGPNLWILIVWLLCCVAVSVRCLLGPRRAALQTKEA
jgi:hypothetical protein